MKKINKGLIALSAFGIGTSPVIILAQEAQNVEVKSIVDSYSLISNREIGVSIKVPKGEYTNVVLERITDKEQIKQEIPSNYLEGKAALYKFSLEDKDNNKINDLEYEVSIHSNQVKTIYEIDNQQLTPYQIRKVDGNTNFKTVNVRNFLVVFDEASSVSSVDNNVDQFFNKTLQDKDKSVEDSVTSQLLGLVDIEAPKKPLEETLQAKNEAEISDKTQQLQNLIKEADQVLAKVKDPTKDDKKEVTTAVASATPNDGIGGAGQISQTSPVVIENVEEETVVITESEETKAQAEAKAKAKAEKLAKEKAEAEAKQTEQGLVVEDVEEKQVVIADDNKTIQKQDSTTANERTYNIVARGKNSVPNPIKGDLWYKYKEETPEDVEVLEYDGEKWTTKSNEKTETEQDLVVKDVKEETSVIAESEDAKTQTQAEQESKTETDQKESTSLQTDVEESKAKTINADDNVKQEDNPEQIETEQSEAPQEQNPNDSTETKGSTETEEQAEPNYVPVEKVETIRYQVDNNTTADTNSQPQDNNGTTITNSNDNVIPLSDGAEIVLPQE